MEKKWTDSLWLNIIMVLSGGAYAVLLMQTKSEVSFAVTGVLALGLMCYLVFRTEFLNRLFRKGAWEITLVAAVLSVAALYTAKSTFYTNCCGWLTKVYAFCHLPAQGLLLRLTPWLVALAAGPMCFGYFLWFTGFMYDFGKRFFEGSDFIERMYLLWAGIFFAAIIYMTFMCTQAFYGAHVNGAWYNFDLIYSADSGYLVHEDVFRNVGASQNDLRQPLYGVFSMPFALVAWLISKVLFFLPQAYVTVLQIIQMFLYLVAVVLLSRMLETKGPEKILFLLMMSSTYPVLIFSLTSEQYLMAVFYLVLMIYLRQEKNKAGLLYIAATGSMLTTGIFFPLVTWDRRFKTFACNTMKLCGAFFGVMILSGRLTTFLDIGSYIAGYAPYVGGDVTPLSKLMQYVNFVGSCFVAPASRVDFETYSHVSWQMVPVTAWRVFGFVVLIGAVLGVLCRPRAAFSKICGVWIGFSFLLLGVIGWGTIDNGLMLYTLYFGWAYVAMCFQLIDRGLAWDRAVKMAVMLGVTAVVLMFNVLALRDVLVFATQFFPALR